ncbi:MAG: hypothetical protein IH830_11980 [Planctomycetes bacterium]|nr:hypothetical protein [Planctomycetota bacterium]
MPEPRREIACAVWDGKIYVFGDYNHSPNNNSAYVYNPESNVWDALEPMLTGRGEAAAAAVDGIIYVIGGNNCFGNCWLTTSEAYNPGSDTWTSKEPMPTTDRGWLTATAVGGKIYVMGGADSHENPSTYDIVEVYYPATNSWDTGDPSHPMPRPRHDHAAVEVDGKIYLIGGTDDASGASLLVPEVDVYDTENNVWTEVAPLPTPRRGLKAATLGGKIYAIGGVDESGNILSLVEVYDPAFDCWTTATAVPTARVWHCAEAVGGTIYVIGGHDDNGSSAANEAGTPLEPLANLDIKPGSCPNSFNRNSHGVLPVALVGTESFDVMEVDLSTVELSRADGVGGSVAPNEGPPGPHSEFEDVATPFEGELCNCHDLEGDGATDLSMKFRTDDVVAALLLNDLPAGDLVELVVSGTLLDGTPFSASDCIRLVPPGTPPGMLAVGSNAPGVFIDVTPLDLQLDGGGFISPDGMFERTFPQTTAVTLTAPAAYHGWVFAGWWTHGALHPDQSIDITIGGDQQTAKAIYIRTDPPAGTLIP